MGALGDLPEDVVLLHELLERIVRAQELSTEALASTRGLVNDTLYVGTALPNASSGIFHRSFAVPFCAVSFADTNAVGLTLSTGTGNEGAGPGVVKAAAGDAGTVPLTGSQLVITVGSTETAGGAFFLAVYTRPRPFMWSKG
jgi:hypothetical protein